MRIGVDANLSFSSMSSSSCGTDFQVDELVAQRERGVSTVEEPESTRNYACTVCIYVYVYIYIYLLMCVFLYVHT